MAKSTTNKGGRPSKFTSDIQSKVELLARRGFIDAEMSIILGVTKRTFDNWKNKHPKFFHSLKDWKKQADHEVERSLYERACGYSHPEVKVQFVQDVVKGGRFETIELEKHYAPDPTSMIFWLKNRQPDVWKDRKEIDANLSGSLTVNIVKFGKGKK